MTELQLKIRRLAHRVSAFKKKGKDTSVIAAELEQLRAQRKAEGPSKKKSPKAETSAEPAPADAPDAVPANG